MSDRDVNDKDQLADDIEEGGVADRVSDAEKNLESMGSSAQNLANDIRNTPDNIKKAAETMKNAPQEIKDTAHNVADAVKHAPENIKNGIADAIDDAKDLAGAVKDAATNVADNVKSGVNNTKDKVNNAKKAVNNYKNASNSQKAKMRDLQKQAIKQKAKNGAKQAGQYAKNGAKLGAKTAGKVVTNAAKNVAFGVTTKIKRLVIGIIVFLFLYVAIIAATLLPTALMSLTAVPVLNSKGEQTTTTVQSMNVELQNYIIQTYIIGPVHDLYVKITGGDKVKLKTNSDGSYEELTQEDLDDIVKANDYEGILNFFCRVIDSYMAEEYENAKNNVPNVATANGYDLELTQAAFAAQPNPLTTVDYSAILSAFCMVDDWETPSIQRFKQFLKNGEGSYLGVYYSDEYKENIIPYEVYAYEPCNQTIKYGDYLKNICKDNSDEVRAEVLYSINYEINKNQDKIEKYSKSSFWQFIHRKEIKELEDKNRNLRKKYKKIERKEIDAKYSDIKYPSKKLNSKVTIELYTRKKNADGTDMVAEEITDKAGKVVDIYEASEQYSSAFNGNMYVYKGKEHVKPTVEYIKYGSPTLIPFDSSKTLETFGIDPKQAYLLSEGYENEITVYDAWMYHMEEMKKDFDLQPFSAGMRLGTMSADQIKAFIDALPSDTSGNRKVIILRALSLTGAVNYQWGGKYPQIGWNPNWWKPSGDASGYIGLDCSGFVQWVYRNAFQDTNDYVTIGSTGEISNNCIDIEHSDLKPGDIGLAYLGASSGTSYNHTGIYAGIDAAGQEVWIHCNGTENTVSVSHGYTGFKKYKRINNVSIMEGNSYWSDSLYDELTSGTTSLNANQDEMFIITRTLCHESGGADDNLRACAEAVANHAIAQNLSMYAQTTYSKNGSYYLDSYKGLYITGKYHREAPTARQISICQEAVSGVRIIFPEGKYPNTVQYWRSPKGDNIRNNPKYTYVGTYANNFYYAN